MIENKIDNFLYESSIKVIRDEFIKDNSEEKVDKILSKFRKLKQLNLIKRPYNDIGHWRYDFEKFADYVNDIYLKHHKKKVDLKNIETVFENDDLLIVIPKTFEATRDFVNHIDAKCPWCISSSSGFWYFDRYAHILGMTPYLIYYKKADPKDPTSLITITINQNNKINAQGGVPVVWKRDDNKNGIPAGPQVKKLKELGVNVEKFQSRLKPNEKFDEELMKPLKNKVSDETFEKVKSYVGRSGPGTKFNTFGNDLYYGITKQKQYENVEYKEDDWKKKFANDVITSTRISEKDLEVVRKFLKDSYFPKLIRGKKYVWKD